MQENRTKFPSSPYSPGFLLSLSRLSSACYVVVHTHTNNNAPNPRRAWPRGQLQRQLRAGASPLAACVNPLLNVLRTCVCAVCALEGGAAAFLLDTFRGGGHNAVLSPGPTDGKRTREEKKHTGTFHE